jgi:hypothetical protein
MIMIRLFTVLFLSQLLAVGAWTESPAQGISDCPNSSGAPFQGGYCRFDPKNKTAIVFVHGVLGDFKSTWANNTSKHYWPALLTTDPVFQDANIYVHPFVSPTIDVAQKVDELALRLGEYLDVDKVISGHARLVFVVHSMGGLVVRAFLVQRRIAPDKVPLIYFFGTPSAGANISNIAALVSYNPQFRDMLPFDRGGYVEQLAMRWLSTSQDQLTGYPRTVWSFCAYEKKGVLGRIVVEELSAAFLCNVQPRAVLSNHIDIVKPADRTKEPYVYFSAAYQFALSPAGKAVGVALGLPSGPAAKFTDTEIARQGGRAFRLKSEVISGARFDVGCEQNKSDIVRVPLKLDAGEELFAARAAWGAVNLSKFLFAVESINPESVGLRYLIEGLPLLLGGCPGEGRAQAVINYVTTRPVR